MAENRVSLITGSSRGIGRAIAIELGAAGHDVVVNYVRNQTEADRVVKEIQSGGGRAVATGANVADQNDRRRLIDSTIERFGRIDVLVNNAGITSPGRQDLLEATEESWDQVFDTNLKGPFFLAQLAARHMRDQTAADTENAADSGVIVNVSSISGYAVSTNRTDYCIAKAGMQMMTWQLADRLAEYGILVYEVGPGVISSDMTAPVKEKYDRLIADGMAPIRRWGAPEDVARAVGMLTSGSLGFSTGERINVDGGFHIRRL